MNMEKRITDAVQRNDYTAISSIFSDSSMSSTQGEQRALAAAFIKIAVNSSNFVPAAFSSPLALSVLRRALSTLPSTVEDAADNTLRESLFNYFVDQEDYREAAAILATKRMEDMDETSVYYTLPHQKSDVYVRIAECFLEGEDFVEAEGAVTRAGSALEHISDPAAHLALILRYKATYARVLDANRKFLQAANRYYDLSKAGAQTDMIADDDLLIMLGRAATCAILAPNGPQRQRLFDSIFYDERLTQLDLLPLFQYHSSILTKMCTNQIIQRDHELEAFENSLEEHHKAMMSDGLTIFQRSLMDHNITALSMLYANIYFSDLAQKLGVTPLEAEQLAARMISNGSLMGSIDQVEGLLIFDYGVHSPAALRDDAIMNFCLTLNRVTKNVQNVLLKD